MASANRATIPHSMELKRLISHFTYRIEPKPEGGFIAHPSDPTVPPLEASTRKELQQKIQANIGAALAAEFPGLKLPLENNQLKFSFHVEHKPGGGFIFQSTDGTGTPIEGATHAEIESQFAGGFRRDSLWFWMEQTAARPKNGRPLQNLLRTRHYGFVEAVPSRVFRDGTGIFVVKLSQSLRIEFRLACPDACYDSGSLGVIV